MKMHTMRLLAVSAAYLNLTPAFAADVVVTAEPVVATATVPAQKIATRFESLAGSPENAQSLVAGLRTGSSITLLAPDAPTGLSFTPATRTMGYGNIAKALLLAQRQLAAQGITQPTPAQLQMALNGGLLTTVDSGGVTRTVEMSGVLQLRSQGMGWGQIAHSLAVSPDSRPSTTTQSSADLHVFPGNRGAIVAGDGSIVHGRTPNTSTMLQTRTQVQPQSLGQASHTSFAHGGSSAMSAGNHGRSLIKARAYSRF